jgi:hypothetical protein
MIKQLILLLLSFAGLAAQANAFNIAQTDLNATPAQLAARYGKPVRVEASWFGGGGLSYSFQPSKTLFVYATTNPYNTKVEDVIYKKLNGSWTRAEWETFILRNTDPHIVYYGDMHEFDVNFDSNGLEDVKHLGKERNLVIKSDYNWTHQIIGKTTDDGGFQVRTKKQFEIEQKFVHNK